MRHALPTLVGLLAGCSITLPALGVGAGLDWVTIGDVGNAGYDRTDPFGRATGRGSVDYAYRISKMEVSSGQWLEFLNAFGDYGDPHRAYSNVVIAGFQPDQSYTGPGRRWELRPEFSEAERMPVLGINWFNAARYCNWLHHGKTTDFDKLEYGAYDLRGSDDLIIAERSEGARYWMPSLDEHLKAAFYDPDKFGDGQGGWWEQPNGTDTELIIGAPSEGGRRTRASTISWSIRRSPMCSASASTRTSPRPMGSSISREGLRSFLTLARIIQRRSGGLAQQRF